MQHRRRVARKIALEENAPLECIQDQASIEYTPVDREKLENDM